MVFLRLVFFIEIDPIHPTGDFQISNLNAGIILTIKNDVLYLTELLKNY